MRTALLISVTVATILLNAASAFGEPVKVSKNVRAYCGPEGVRVVVAAVLPKSKNRALVRVSGADSLLDGVVFLASVEDLGSRGSTLKLTWQSRSWGVLTSRKFWWGNKTCSYTYRGKVRCL